MTARQQLATAKFARLSDDGLYRYLLTRTWDPAVRLMRFVMLNPSTADAEVEDPTIRRCMGFAHRFGFGGISVLNLYAWRATRPADLWKSPDPVGPENDDLLRAVFVDAAEHSGIVVAAWGVNAPDERVREVCRMTYAMDVLHCLGTTRRGAPRHPLYLPNAAELTPWVSL